MAAGAAMLFLACGCAGARPDGAVAPAEPTFSGHGFHGMEFGTSFSSVKHEMKFMTRKGKWQFFTRRREKLTQGQAELAAVHYGFHRGKLLSITVYAKGPDNASRLLDWLNDNYGPSRPGEAGRIFWDHEQVRAIYEFNTANQTALLSVSSRKLLQVREAEGE